MLLGMPTIFIIYFLIKNMIYSLYIYIRSNYVISN